MISGRHPLRDRVALASAATTGFSAKNTARSQGAYAVDACIAALQAAGLGAADVDGICGSMPSAPWVQAALGIPEVTWFANPVIPFLNQLAAAVAAVHSGLCDVVLAYHASYRLAWNTASALRDPFRRGQLLAAGNVPGPESIGGSVAYAAWAARYLAEYQATSETFARISINDRYNALTNPAAAMTSPVTMDEYLASRMVRWPLRLLDMDVPVDGGDAFVITTAERAADLPLRPVLVHALSLGAVNRADEDQQASLIESGQRVVVDALRARSGFWIDDIDIYFPYDGFTLIAIQWIESVGWCGRGEAGDFLAEHADPATGRIMIDGRLPLNPHGGSLGEGGTQGSGHLREAVHQLQGLAGERQVPGARRALLTLGGMFFNAQGVALRVE